jgi:aspartate racemase
MAQLKAIGLVGGLGPGSTIHYYDHLTRAFSARGESPGLFITHADRAFVQGRVEAQALDELAHYFAEHIGRLERAGAAFAAITAIAPHICASELKALSPLPLLDLIDCVRAELAARRLHRVALFGTRYVMQSDMYGRLGDFDVVRPAPDLIDFVHRNYMHIASTGALAGADVEGVRSMAQSLVRDQGVQAIVLAGTDFSLAFTEADCGFPAIDSSRVHIDAILAEALAATRGTSSLLPGGADVRTL